MRDKDLRQQLDDMGIVKDFGRHGVEQGLEYLRSSLQVNLNQYKINRIISDADKIKLMLEGIIDYLTIEPEESGETAPPMVKFKKKKD